MRLWYLNRVRITPFDAKEQQQLWYTHDYFGHLAVIKLSAQQLAMKFSKAPLSGHFHSIFIILPAQIME